MRKQRYPVARSAECQLAYAECTAPRFHEMLGHAIEADRLPTEDAQALVSAAQEVARNSGVPCASTTVALQQLRMRVHAGKMTLEAVRECEDLILAVEDAGGIQDLQGLINVLAPAIKSVGFQDAVEATIQTMGHGADPDDAAELFSKLGQLGKGRVSMGSAATWTQADIVEAASSTIRDPLPTGIDELDAALGGGLERATLGMFLGGSGDGKSLALCHAASEAMLCGHVVGYVTLELGESSIKQRVYANCLGMTPNEMVADPAEALRRRGMMDGWRLNNGYSMGSFRTLYLTPKVGSVAQIKQWLRDVERDFKEVIDVLLVDYVDKLSSKGHAEKGTYHEQGATADQLRNLIIERDGWCWTASQTQGRAGRKKKVDLEDVADSMEKVRIADTVIAIMRTEEDTQQGSVRFRLPKRRNAQAHGEVGPLTMDPERGRMVATNRCEPW